ncbi:MAG: helix-turn-helix domain-containing protein [Pseudonocardiaceae bacterium]
MSDESAGQPEPIDPAIYWRDDVRRILATLDIASLYLILKDTGLSQRQIAARTGQSQSEVADIVARRRRVENHDLLQRIAGGLSIPLEFMGLSWWGPDGTYCGVVPVAELPEGVSAEMFRRHLLVLGAAAAFGNPIKGLGRLQEQVGIPASESMPSQLFGVHIVQVRELTRGLREALLDHAPSARPPRAVPRRGTPW